MSYEQFLEKIEHELSECVGANKKVFRQSALKNNGFVRKGITFQEAGINISPTIYMEEYYERFQRTGDMKQIVQAVMELYQQVKLPHSWEGNFVHRYMDVQDKIIYQLVNREENEQMLREVPHIPYLDLAIIFYVLVEIDVAAERLATMIVKKEQLAWWGVQVEDIYQAAHRNTERLLPYDFSSMSAAVGDMLEEEIVENVGDLYVLSNVLRNYGAAAILYEQRLERIGDYFRESYFVLPSSIHEVLIIPESKAAPQDDLSSIVREVNETQVRGEEVLSNHAYYYDRDKKRLMI